MPRLRARSALLAPLALCACGVSRVPPTPPRPAAPIPLVLGVCPLPTGAPAEPFGRDGALFTRVVDVRTTDVRPDVVVHVAATPVTRDVRENSVGFFMWTLGVVPMLTDVGQTATATFHPVAPEGDPCAPRGADGTGLAIAAAGRDREVVGWVAWLLQPLPWWSGSHEVDGEPKVARRERVEIARAVIARRAEILALARR